MHPDDEDEVVERDQVVLWCSVCHKEFGHKPICPDCRQKWREKKEKMEQEFKAQQSKPEAQQKTLFGGMA